MEAVRTGMIVTDLDGTLLRGDNTVSPRTRQVLGRLREQGVRLVYATARPLRTLRPIVERYPCDGFLYHNGAVVCASDGWSVTNAIPYVDAVESIRAMEHAFAGIHLSVEAGGTLYRNFVPEEPGRFPGKFTDLQKLPSGEVLKIVADRAQVPSCRVLEPYVPPGCYLELCEDRLVLIMHRSASKLQGAERLREHFGVPKEQVVAFGDDYNDIEMLSFYYGVAMENAIAPARAAAREITPSNERDGVAAFLLRADPDGWIRPDT